MDIKIKLIEKNNWHHIKSENFAFWYKGIIINLDFIKLFEKLKSIEDIDNLKKLVNFINGQFSFLFIDNKKKKIIFAVDKISSVPLFYSKFKNKIIFYNFVNIKNNKINNDSLLSYETSGYSIGTNTIIENINALEAGDCGILNNETFIKVKYFLYSPWNKKLIHYDQLSLDCEKILISSVKDLINIAKNRTIVVPLSNGYDSRLIVSILRYLNYNNVICFSYGKKNSKIKSITSQIAKKLNYKFFFLDINYRDKKKFFLSKEYFEFITQYNSVSSIPSIQDIYEIYLIKKRSLIPNDSIIVNGQTGDFITGGHIPKNLKDVLVINNSEKAINEYINKNFSLWENLLKTDINYELIKNSLKNFLLIYNNKLEDYIYESSIYEFLEYYLRQSKYIMNQQAIYDYYNYNWYMPLWNDKMILFWQGVEDKYKFNQYLYKNILIKNNYGLVWKDIPVNTKLINLKLRIIRNIFKPLFLYSKKNWIKFDKRFFKYWNDDTCNYAIVSFIKIIFSYDSHRNYASWVGKKYLKVIKKNSNES